MPGDAAGDSTLARVVIPIYRYPRAYHSIPAFVGMVVKRANEALDESHYSIIPRSQEKQYPSAAQTGKVIIHYKHKILSYSENRTN